MIGLIEMQSFLNRRPKEYPEIVAHLWEMTVGMDSVALSVFQDTTHCSQLALILLCKVIEHLNGIVFQKGVGVEEEDVIAVYIF